LGDFFFLKEALEREEEERDMKANGGESVRKIGRGKFLSEMKM